MIHETERLSESSGLVTALALSNTDPSTVSATLTSGEVLVLRLAESTITTEHCFEAHTEEAWISAFGAGTYDHVLLSGGDDCVLNAFDTREGMPLWSRRFHTAGVTSILPSGTGGWSPNADGYTVWTGGYDDCVRTFDLRMAEIPMYGKAKDLGGGVWRLLPKPGDASGTVLACCMYGGARILRPDASAIATTQETITKGHESMVYGGAWSASGDMFTCSFYDKQLRRWHGTSINN